MHSVGFSSDVAISGVDYLNADSWFLHKVQSGLRDMNVHDNTAFWNLGIRPHQFQTHDTRNSLDATGVLDRRDEFLNLSYTPGFVYTDGRFCLQYDDRDSSAVGDGCSKMNGVLDTCDRKLKLEKEERNGVLIPTDVGINGQSPQSLIVEHRGMKEGLKNESCSKTEGQIKTEPNDAFHAFEINGWTPIKNVCYVPKRNSWRVRHKKHDRCYSIKKHGFNEARDLAIEKKREWVNDDKPRKSERSVVSEKRNSTQRSKGDVEMCDGEINAIEGDATEAATYFKEDALSRIRQMSFTKDKSALVYPLMSHPSVVCDETQQGVCLYQYGRNPHAMVYGAPEGVNHFNNYCMIPSPPLYRCEKNNVTNTLTATSNVACVGSSTDSPYFEIICGNLRNYRIGKNRGNLKQKESKTGEGVTRCVAQESLPRGVRYDSQKNAYRVVVKHGISKKDRSFSVNKFGKVGALQKAISCVIDSEVNTEQGG